MHPIQGLDKAMAGAESPVQDLVCFCPGTVACVQCRREKVVLVPNGSWQKIRQSTVFIHRVFGGYSHTVFIETDGRDIGADTFSL